MPQSLTRIRSYVPPVVLPRRRLLLESRYGTSTISGTCCCLAPGITGYQRAVCHHRPTHTPPNADSNTASYLFSADGLPSPWSHHSDKLSKRQIDCSGHSAGRKPKAIKQMAKNLMDDEKRGAVVRVLEWLAYTQVVDTWHVTYWITIQFFLLVSVLRGFVGAVQQTLHLFKIY